MSKSSKRRIIRKYSEEFKLTVVNAVEQEGMGVSEASIHYKVPERSIYTWRNKYGEKREVIVETVDLNLQNKVDKIKQLETLVSELSIKCRVLREQIKIYEQTVGDEGKKKLSMKQLEELERLKKEMEDLMD